MAAQRRPLEAFARARGLVPQRIAWWRKRLEQQRPTTTPCWRWSRAVRRRGGACARGR